MFRNLYLSKSTLKEYTQDEENEIYQKFAKGYNLHKDRPELKGIVEEITIYRQMLKLLNIKDE